MKEEIQNSARVVLEPMTGLEARGIFPYRPFSKYAESKHGGNNLVSDQVLLMRNHAKHCKMCSAPTKKTHLLDGICLDCDGRAERSGFDPRKPLVPVLITHHRSLHTIQY